MIWLIRLGSELTTNFVGVQSFGSPDIVLVGFEPESVRFRILVLLNLLGVTPVILRDRTGWSSRMLLS